MPAFIFIPEPGASTTNNICMSRHPIVSCGIIIKPAVKILFISLSKRCRLQNVPHSKANQTQAKATVAAIPKLMNIPHCIRNRIRIRIRIRICICIHIYICMQNCDSSSWCWWPLPLLGPFCRSQKPLHLCPANFLQMHFSHPLSACKSKSSFPSTHPVFAKFVQYAITASESSFSCTV